MIWDEVGEDQFERDKVLVDLEHECLQVYRRKVDNANMSRARLHQELADSEAQFTHLLLSLDERSLATRVSSYFPNTKYDEKYKKCLHYSIHFLQE